MKTLATPRHSAFTLVEILVVLAIIGILAALLFPAFARARESGRQTNCASNLQQLGVAVKQYYQDTKRYPDSIVDLLPDGAAYLNGGVEMKIGQEPTNPTRGTGYLKGGEDALKCLNDDVDDLHSSYGALEKSPPAMTATSIAGNYVFNYWGYKNDGFILTSPQGVAALLAASPGNRATLRNPAALYEETNPLNNPVKYSLSNRYAPDSTIIAHCVYHRPNTANDLALPTDLYQTPTPIAGDGTGARDIVLRLDGSAKVVDVSQWNVSTAPNLSKWMVQN